MGTILIDKLLSACVKQGASRRHITGGQPPALRLHGRVPEIFKGLIARPRGLVIVTGPTGSGKTTSLAAMVDYLNENFDHHIITIEDPIEFQHEHKKSTINQREVGVDVTSFKEALRRALRQDPDVIMVGEMRDLE